MLENGGRVVVFGLDGHLAERDAVNPFEMHAAFGVNGDILEGHILDGLVLGGGPYGGRETGKGAYP